MIRSQLDLQQREKGGFCIYRIPGIVRTAAGSLLVTYECREKENDWSTRAVALQRSTDGGKTWSERILMAHQTETAVNNPVLLAAPDGTVYLLYMHEYLRTFLRVSRDDGVTFSPAREITSFFDAFRPEFDFTRCAIGPGHGLTLSSGRLIVPVWLARNTDDLYAHRPSVVSVLFSDDGGKTWQRGGLIKGCLLNPSETTAALLPDGRLQFNLRNENPEKCRAIAFSADGGLHWTQPQLSPALPDPTCCGSQSQSADGTIFFSNCRDHAARRALCITKIAPDGLHAEAVFPLYANVGDALPSLGGAGYSDLAVSPDGKTAWCFFERDQMSALTLQTVALY